MTPEQIAIVRATASALGPRTERLCGRFSERLHAAAPQMDPPMADVLEEQCCRLAEHLVHLAGAVGDLDRFLAEARALGSCYDGCGLRPEHYPVLGRVLIETLAEVVGPSFDDAAAEAWRCLYLLASESMLEGAAEALFAASAPAPRRTCRPGRM